MDEELKAASRNVYLLQKSLQEIVAELDKLKGVCQPIYDRVYNDNGDVTVDECYVTNDLLAVYHAMKRYNRKSK